MKSLTEYINNCYITEMANSLNDFERLLDNVLEQLIENWCLIRFCDLYPTLNISKQNRNHWCAEFKSYANKIINTKIKSGRKDKAIKRVIINKAELNDWNEVANIIRNKLCTTFVEQSLHVNKEGLSKYIYKLSNECANNINNICNILSTDDKNNVDDYLFGEIL